MLIAGLQPLESVASPCLWRGCGGKRGHLHPGAARQQGCGTGFKAMLNPAEGQLINSRIPLSQGEHQAGGWAVQRGAKLPPPMPRAQTPLSLPSHGAQFWACPLCCRGLGALSRGCWGWCRAFRGRDHSSRSAALCSPLAQSRAQPLLPEEFGCCLEPSGPGKHVWSSKKLMSHVSAALPSGASARPSQESQCRL